LVSEKIIKPGTGAGSPASRLIATRVVKGQAYDASIDAAHIIEAAHTEARAILDAARQERQAVLKDARREGYDEGLQLWHAAVEEANAVRDRRMAESEPELVRLAVRIAEKIIGEELRLNPQTTVSIARQCLQWLRREKSVVLRVSPAEIDLLRERIDSLREAAGPHRSIEVIADPAISCGGCIVESEYGVIDARVETQIRGMEEILLRAARK
jgi:type III secretion protein L